jgi:hypothetical protein
LTTHIFSDRRSSWPNAPDGADLLLRLTFLLFGPHAMPPLFLIVLSPSSFNTSLILPTFPSASFSVGSAMRSGDIENGNMKPIVASDIREEYSTSTQV